MGSIFCTSSIPGIVCLYPELTVSTILHDLANFLFSITYMYIIVFECLVIPVVNSGAVNSSEVNSIEYFLSCYFLRPTIARVLELNTPHLPFLILHLTGQLHLNGQGVKWFVWDLSYFPIVVI